MLYQSFVNLKTRRHNPNSKGSETHKTSFVEIRRFFIHLRSFTSVSFVPSAPSLREIVGIFLISHSHKEFIFFRTYHGFFITQYFQSHDDNWSPKKNNHQNSNDTVFTPCSASTCAVGVFFLESIIYTTVNKTISGLHMLPCFTHPHPHLRKKIRTKFFCSATYPLMHIFLPEFLMVISG